ncbi:MAG: CusA/CzcA family heavy metal efflux RND transporter, partial [Bacteroidales bacterium]|nr:CusA/CzcA family heavy metal efflux RND transporter [Bacteroidales bacterium]
MLNRIIRLSLENRLMVLIIAGAILLWGCFTLLNTDVDIFPDLNAPTVVVMTEAPGMTPEDVETSLTYPIETAINGANGLRRVRSSSYNGFSVVWAEFDWGMDEFHARQTISERLSALEGQLPPEVSRPLLGPQTSILGEIMIIGLTSDSLSLGQLRTLAERQIKPRLLSVGGVAQVSVIGGEVEEYQVTLDPAAMHHLGVTTDDVRESLQSFTSNVAGGVVNAYGNEYLVKGAFSSSSPQVLTQAVIAASSSAPVVLADIASVRKDAKQPKIGSASLRAQEAVLITITKQPSASTLTLSEEIDETLGRLSTALPQDVKISTDIFRQADFIQRSVSNLQTSLFEGAIFVIVVLFFFLMNLRTTLISLIALPLSIIVTVIILHLLGLTINTMSLGGIAIAIGSLVDDAIVDVENVYRRLRENARLPQERRVSTAKVVYEASSEVRLPILNSSLIIIASFLPLFFLHGIEGRLLIPLGISFIVALAASTIVALTLTPVLSYYLLGPKDGKVLSKDAPIAVWIRRHYERWLSIAFAHQNAILLSIGGLFLVAVGLFFTLGRSFLPPFNEGSLTVNISTLPGITFEDSNCLGREAEKIILGVEEVTTVARKTGRAEMDEHSLGSNVSELEVPYVLKGRSRQEMVADLRQRLSVIPGAVVEIGQPISHRIDAMLSGTEAQVAVKIFGDDLSQLYALGCRVGELMKRQEALVDVNVEPLILRPQLAIRPRPHMMARYGVTYPQLAASIRLLGGEIVGQVIEHGQPFDITLRLPSSALSSPEAIAKTMVDTPVGQVALDQIAEIIFSEGPNTINRENSSRRIVVSANVDHSDLRGVVASLRKAIGHEIALPQGYYIEYGGQFESEAKASRTLAWATIGAVFLILLLLYSEYKNVAQPLIILLNMPLAAIGGVIILWLTTKQLNIPAIIGFIALIGITTRNGMLLMSRYKALTRENIRLKERIFRGSGDRLSPIIMTALSSALALIPLVVRGDQPGNEVQAPLALVILGGLLTSTILNIFVVPIVYYKVS